MTNKLRKAFETAAKLPAGEQDALAMAIMEEIQSDARWSAILASNPGALERLANEALDEQRAGQTRPLVSDEI